MNVLEQTLNRELHPTVQLKINIKKTLKTRSVLKKTH